MNYFAIAVLLRMFHVPLMVFIPFFVGLIFLLLGIKDFREDDENNRKTRLKRLYKEIAKSILFMLTSVFVWLVFY
ncbi:MAG: hypothetical protein IPP32_04145 [Bacteroidetes bacterium]|nr:hypothetical protein [Bacteroidota bacterium]